MANNKLNRTITNLCYRFSTLHFHGLKPQCRFSSTLVTNKSLTNTTASNNFQSMTVVNQTYSSKLKLASSSSSLNEYVCPGLAENNKDVILEKPGSLGVYNCPTIMSRLEEIIAPEIHKLEIFTPPSINQNTSKEAGNILRIRRRKMNKHKLKKMRFKQMFKRRAYRRLKAKKKEMVLLEELASIHKWADDFDAEKFAQSELELARRGGFSVDVFKTQESRTKE